MLTNRDLSQIQKIVHTEIQSETPGIVRDIVQSETPRIVRRIVQEETSSIIQKELKPIKKDIQTIKKDINLIVRSFDRDYVALRKRVERLETHPSPLFTHA
jgi:hypothetical protein